MSKTQLLSDTENLCIAREKTHKFDTENNKLHSTNSKNKWLQNGKQEVFSMLHFWRHLHNKYTTDP
jgi:hypothetical protein